MDGATRAGALTQRLLAFSRQQALSPVPLDPNKLLSGMEDLLHRTLGEAVQVETVLAAQLWMAHADPSQLENAVLNLAVNARDAMDGRGKLTIETANTRLDDVYAREHDVVAGQYVMIAVSDTGSGMTPAVMAQVFDPYFTTKEIGKGTGLGLSQVYGFVRQSGASMARRPSTSAGQQKWLQSPAHAIRSCWWWRTRRGCANSPSLWSGSWATPSYMPTTRPRPSVSSMSTQA